MGPRVHSEREPLELGRSPLPAPGHGTPEQLCPAGPGHGGLHRYNTHLGARGTHLSRLVLVQFLAQAQLFEVNPSKFVQGPIPYSRTGMNAHGCWIQEAAPTGHGGPMAPPKGPPVLTGPGAGRALPERVLVGDLGEALAQLLSTLCRGRRRKVAPRTCCGWPEAVSVMGSWETLIPFRTSRSGVLALSVGVSPYLLAMLTRAPLPTRSCGRRERGLWFVISPQSPSHPALPPAHAPTHLSHLLVSPEAGIVQRCVPVLIHRIDVCFELHQLGTGDTPCEPRSVPVSPG